MSPSPAERYAAARNRARHPGLLAFTETLSFPLDDFQRQACEAVADGRSVLVAAPTGAGKTVVGEFAVKAALDRGEKAFYTTPIKALSNQKFNELMAVYGEDRVGLLTGDQSLRGEADVVVMTTEVLRNMIYANSRTLDRLGVVVLDEVHYLADRFRGSVWEEVIVHLDQAVAIVALSATVSNAEEFGDWLREVRGNTDVIVSETRPVPLWPHVLLREGIFDLYAPGVDPADPGPSPRLNPEVEALARRQRHDYVAPGRGRARGGRRPQGRRAPPRFATVDVLDANGLLPAIFFVFSRAGCEDAVDQVRSSGLQLTSREERERIIGIVEERCAALPTEDLNALGYSRWLDHLSAGIAAHHAGMIPLFKETVEKLFLAGLIKVVFATETLALGINMPARSVVLEKLVKWDGEGHKDLTAGEYTQLTGRAGRRGIDVEGHAVVVEHPGFDAQALGRLASRRTYPLVSSFHPSYNMALNLVARSGIPRAREVLSMSFAQYQADQGVVSQARKVRSLDEDAQGMREAATCSRGDFLEYAGMRERITRLQKQQSKASSKARKDATEATLRGLERGTVVRIGAGKNKGLAVVVVADDTDRPRPLVVTEAARAMRLSVAELHHGLDPVGQMRLAKGLDTRQARARRDLAATMRAKRGEFTAGKSRGGRGRTAGNAEADAVDAIRRQMRAHPCHGCPDREDHARWAERYFKALRDKDRIASQISAATGSIARAFDKRCDVLSELGYLEGEGDERRATEAGAMLQHVFSENDLAIAECLRRGVWDGLGAPALAAVVSSLVYSGRREDENETPQIPQGRHGPLGAALDQTYRVWSNVDDIHEGRGLPATPQPHWGLVAPIHGWAAGKSLAAVLRGTELAPGDMVRWCKQVIDVMGQIEDVAPSHALKEAARAAIDSMRRGVVAY